MQMLQQEKEQEMQLARQQALFVDAQAGLQFLEAGNYDEIVELGMNRLQNLQQLGAEDPSDTQRLTQLAIAARNGSEEARELLRNELTSTVNIGRATGMLKLLKGKMLQPLWVNYNKIIGLVLSLRSSIILALLLKWPEKK